MGIATAAVSVIPFASSGEPRFSTIVAMSGSLLFSHSSASWYVATIVWVPFLCL